MHVVFRESHGLEETAVPVDLAQDTADLLMLSFSDSDLAAFAAGWRRARAGLPNLRLANLASLKHPLSVDTYLDRTLSHARGDRVWEVSVSIRPWRQNISCATKKEAYLSCY